MQAAGSICFSSNLLLPKNTKSLLMPISASFLRPKTKRAKLVLTKVASGGGGGGGGGGADSAAVDSVVDYSSLGSVFPAEARETIGGESHDAAIYPEAKLTASKKSAEAPIAVEEFEREYLDYNQQKTVFPDEACDDLGGEFCDPEYQIGIGKEASA